MSYIDKIIERVDGLLDSKEYAKAIDLANETLENHPTTFKLRLLLAIAYQRNGKYAKSFNASEIVIVDANKAGNKPDLAQGQLRRAISLFFMNRFHEAAYSLDLALKYAEGESKFINTANVWKHKINQKLENKPFDMNFITISEIPGFQPTKSLSIPKACPTPAAPSATSASTAAPASGVVENTVPAVEKAAVAPSSSAPAPQSMPASTLDPVTDKIKFDWYQNSNGINISLFIKNTPKDKVSIDFTQTSISISFPLPNGSDFFYEFSPLAGLIDPKASTFRVFGTKIEFNLVKADTTKWPALLGEGASNLKDDRSAHLVTAEKAQKFLNSSIGVKKWDSIVRDEVAELEKEENDNDPNAFFKTIFANADPDTQRAMMKSYTESNGTALSTSWEDASKRKFETVPPEGLEARKWGK
jgi:suppressor of G2 allele of SKP1